MGEIEDKKARSRAVFWGRFLAVMMLVVLMALLATALHAVALASVQLSRTASQLDTRISAAEGAAFIEPWNAAFKTRRATLQAQRLVTRHRIEEAYRVLESVPSTERGDKDYKAIFEKVSSERTRNGGPAPSTGNSK